MTVLKWYKTSFLPQIDDCLYRLVTSASTVHYIKDLILIEPDNLSTAPLLYIAAVGTAWSPLGSPTNSHATVHLFQIIYSSQHSFVTSVTLVTFKLMEVLAWLFSFN